jgi:hypothetical protein
MGVNHRANRRRSRANRGPTKRTLTTKTHDHSSWLTVFPEDEERIEHEETAEDDEPDAPRTQPFMDKGEQRRR